MMESRFAQPHFPARQPVFAPRSMLNAAPDTPGSGRRRRLSVEQSGVAKVRPQSGRDRMAQQLQISVKFVYIARTWNDRGHHGMSKRELHRRRRKWHPM